MYKTKYLYSVKKYTFNATVPAVVVIAPITTTFSICIIVLYDFFISFKRGSMLTQTHCIQDIKITALFAIDYSYLGVI